MKSKKNIENKKKIEMKRSENMVLRSSTKKQIENNPVHHGTKKKVITKNEKNMLQGITRKSPRFNHEVVIEKKLVQMTENLQKIESSENRNKIAPIHHELKKQNAEKGAKKRDKKPNKSNQITKMRIFEKNEIVWVKLKGFPYWPAKVNQINLFDKLVR